MDTDRPWLGPVTLAAALGTALLFGGRKNVTKAAEDATPPVDQTKDIITMQSILAEDPHDPPKAGGHRKWIPKLPAVFRKEATRALNEAELAKVKEMANSDGAPVPQGQPPKLILFMGAAGTGKSFRQKDCLTKFGVDSGSVVLIDGDDVRECHQGVQAALNLDKKTLLDALTGKEKAMYEKQLEGYADDVPIGFEDCAKWIYEKSVDGKSPSEAVKLQVQNEAFCAKKDIVLPTTALKPNFRKVIDKAMEAGYHIYTAGFLVKPEILLQRQLGRARESGRLITVDASIKNGDLVASTYAKQAKAVKGLVELLEKSAETGGASIIFDNTPDFRTEVMNNPVYERDGLHPPSGDFQGFTPSEGGITVNGMVEFIHSKFQSRK